MVEEVEEKAAHNRPNQVADGADGEHPGDLFDVSVCALLQVK